jgi:hypothetical protein
MNSAHTLTAKWSADYTQPALIIGLVIAVAIGIFVVVFYTRHKRYAEQPKSEPPAAGTEVQPVLFSVPVQWVS